MTWKSFVVFLGLFAVWGILTRVVLPWCGVETCCSSADRCPGECSLVGQCDLPTTKTVASNPEDQLNLRQGDRP